MVEHFTTCPIAQGTGTDCRCRGVVDAHDGYATAAPKVLMRGNKRYTNPPRPCFRCAVLVREQILSSRPNRLVDAETLEKHYHDWSKIPVPPRMEVTREAEFSCGSCHNPATLKCRVGMMVHSLCDDCAGKYRDMIDAAIAADTAPRRAPGGGVCAQPVPQEKPLHEPWCATQGHVCNCGRANG